MKRRLPFRFALLGWICCTALPGFAATAWDEDAAGDFSNDGLAPTLVSIGPGSNLILGHTGDDGSGIDRDYFRFIVPAGAELRSLVLQNSTTVSGSASFIAIQEGPQLTVSPFGAGVENLLGFTHYGSDIIGQDLLPLLAWRHNGVLPSGSYSVWVQETGGPVSYGLDLVMTAAVPEPAAAALLAAGLLGLALSRRRRPAGQAQAIR